MAQAYNEKLIQDEKPEQQKNYIHIIENLHIGSTIKNMDEIFQKRVALTQKAVPQGVETKDLN